MAPGRKTGGRRPGSRNKATIEREIHAALVLKRIEEAERLRAEGAARELAEARTSGVRLAKDVLEDFMRLFAELAMVHQPIQEEQPIPPGRKPDAAKFKEWADRACAAAKDLMPYQSPRLSAVMVGSAVVNKIEIIGGIPDEEDGGLTDGIAAPVELAGSSMPNASNAEVEGGC
jgi:hypothetical protein